MLNNLENAAPTLPEQAKPDLSALAEHPQIRVDDWAYPPRDMAAQTLGAAMVSLEIIKGYAATGALPLDTPLIDWSANSYLRDDTTQSQRDSVSDFNVGHFIAYAEKALDAIQSRAKFRTYDENGNLSSYETPLSGIDRLDVVKRHCRFEQGCDVQSIVTNLDCGHAFRQVSQTTRDYFRHSSVQSVALAMTEETVYYRGHAHATVQRAGLANKHTTCALPVRWRETLRLLSGVYVDVPWSTELAPIEGHYVHIDMSQPGQVRFTADERKGAAFIRVTTRAGRYLTKYYPALSKTDVERYQALLATLGTLQTAKTADEIEKVYTNGPRSCMSHKRSSYSSSVHPVRVYGDSDLQLAYIQNGPDSYSARALIWPDKKRYGRVYGDISRLTAMLEANGYVKGDFHGARIRAIEEGQGYVMPYVDDAAGADYAGGGWLRLSSHGDLDTKTTDGCTHAGECCPNCGERCDEGDLVTTR